MSNYLVFGELWFLGRLCVGFSFQELLEPPNFFFDLFDAFCLLPNDLGLLLDGIPKAIQFLLLNLNDHIVELASSANRRKDPLGKIACG